MKKQVDIVRERPFTSRPRTTCHCDCGCRKAMRSGATTPQCATCRRLSNLRARFRQGGEKGV